MVVGGSKGKGKGARVVVMGEGMACRQAEQSARGVEGVQGSGGGGQVAMQWEQSRGVGW